MAEKKVKVPNYSAELTEEITTRYLAGESCADIGASVGKGEKSVRAKLIREGVYKAPEKGAATSPKSEGPSKKELLADIGARAPNVPVDGLIGATKEALAAILAFLPEPAKVEMVEATESVAA